MRSLQIVVLALVSILMGACSTNYYYADFIKPSNRYIPAAVYVVGIAERSVTPESTCPVYTDGIPYEYLKRVPQQTATFALNNLDTLVTEIGRFAFIKVDVDDSVISDKTFATPRFTKQELDSIGRRYDLDGLISLDGCEMLIRTSGEVNVVSVNDGSGMPVRVPEFSKESQVSLTLLWRFYDCKSGEILDEYQESYERVFGRISYSEEDIGELKPEDMSLMDVAGMAAYDYYERISPHWQEGYRKLYFTGSDKLQEIASDLNRTGNWEDAAAEWKKLVDDENLKVRHRAIYNMAVASEIMGTPRVAKEWIDRAMVLDPNRQTRQYAEQLEKQIVIYEVVNRQLGIQ